ncbi:bifunctional proline dehydrogenase/L-glutamate gamma-semialdehyde dehydrogenase [Corynebacterium guangdongense]|uniref:L-glutamate gamma-semialdehyde dehydrogenase n=1 Tax=Corynebacterium guangdongense TaxID=1783348 RepID=A0ABU1ZYI9_9CORY|nr:bifunctional proline dehydrogenase/L-glutamate gamma-semialdehyde dehydrogenase [Corynebacterium guangdongense]MDR7329825.1 RHH-type proline utilization regulon transcriptional repressor/proline dehydrogenase/delta 1-pyrroline-5-carboxylate dehydrogenase [Corynebacterium guangdongense]WJZ18388.1 Bifunctional protein PutA [Corynebacterium guangdongense]
MTSPNNRLVDLEERILARAGQWLQATEDAASASDDARNSELLAELLRHPDGVAFTMDFVDRVARPEDNRVAAAEMRKMTEAPAFLGLLNRAMFSLGSAVSKLAPDVVMPLARGRLRQMVSHLIFDSGGSNLDTLLDKAADRGVQLNLNLLGEAVLGHAEAESRARRTAELIENPRVTYVSVKASSLCAQLNHWDEDGSVARLKEQLRPLYRKAQANGTFINLDMEEYKDFDVTLRLFMELLMEEEFLDYEAGIVLQAYLPDSVGALDALIDFAHTRVDAGGAPIKVRLVKGANLSMERVDAEIHGWEQTPYATKHEVDANYLRLLDVALRPEHAGALRIGVASHNTYTLAAAHELAVGRGVLDQVDAEMLQGMSPAQSQVIHEAFGTLILYTPVVAREDFDVAVSYLVRRLEENAEPHNFIYALFADDQEAMEAQRERFRRALADAHDVPAEPRRGQDRTQESGRQAPGRGFHNEPDTDPALEVNRDWAVATLAAPGQEVTSPEIADLRLVDDALETARRVQPDWAALSGHERAKVLETVADELADARGELIAVMAHEAGKTIAQSDPEVSEAIDFATYYAASARALEDYQSVFTPHQVTAVIPPWNFPVAIPVGGMLAALAAGSAVIVKPAPQVVACSEVAVAAIHRGLAAHGVDTDLLQLLRADEGEAGKHLITHVDNVILTGGSDTAALFRSWSPRMTLSAETSGKNAIIVTPAADPDLAVADVVDSAFGHAGQKCSAASLLILVGSMGRSERFLNQLVDATRSLHVGPGTDISVRVNGLIEPPGEKLARGLTTLDAGESWLLEPRQLDEEGRFWHPGIRDGVTPGSWFHTHECFGPVLGVMRARDLDEAIAWQNSTGFGLTGGIHSLDDEEIAHWVEQVEVGNAYVNRGITGAIVRRQSFGGWKDSVIGAGAKAGGPNYVAQQGTWTDGELTLRDVTLDPAIERRLRVLERDLPAEDAAWLRRAAESDARAVDAEFGRRHDRSALRSEANVFRYRPLLDPLIVRVGEGWRLRDLHRLILGAQAVGTELEISTAPEVHAEVARVAPAAREVSDTGFARELDAGRGRRIRLLGGAEERVYAAAVRSGSVVLDAPVLAEGRRELLSMLLEQALTVTTHRFGVLRRVGGFGG